MDELHFITKWEGCGGQGVQCFNASFKGRWIMFVNLNMESFNGVVASIGFGIGCTRGICCFLCIVWLFFILVDLGSPIINGMEADGQP